MKSVVLILGSLGLASALGAQQPVIAGLDAGEASLSLPSFAESLDAGGRRLTFRTAAALLPADTDAFLDVYLRDRDPDANGIFDEGNSTLTLVSKGPSPHEAGQPFSHAWISALSADGSAVAFESRAPLLPSLPAAGNPRNVFAYDVATDTLTLVSLAHDGSPADGASTQASPSADGSVIAFQSAADNLVAGLAPSIYERVFVVDGGVTSCVSLTPGGASPSGLGADARSPALSADGRFVAFVSGASDLVPSDTNGRDDVFVHDRVSGVTTLVSRATGGALGDGHASEPALSPDGRYVVFASEASDLSLPVDLSGVRHVYLHDRDPDANGVFDEGNGSTQRLSPAFDPALAHGDSFHPALSHDARFVAFTSDSELDPVDNNGAADVFLFDRDPDDDGSFDPDDGLLSVASRAHYGGLDFNASGVDGLALASVGGPQLLFTHQADGLVAGDSNGVADAVLLDARHWRDLGHPLPDSSGFVSRALGSGPLTVGDPILLSVIDLVPASTTRAVLGLGHLGLPFKGGVLVPTPDHILPPLPTGGSGSLVITPTWPAGVPSGLVLRLQWWTNDPGSPSGFAASNALRVLVP